MSVFLRKIASAINWDTAKEFVLQVAPSIYKRLYGDLVDRSCYQVLSLVAGKPAATAVQITFPYLSKAKKVAQDVLNGDGDLVLESIQKSQKKLLKSVIVVLSSSPDKLATLYIGNKMTKGTLKSIGAALDNLLHANVGKTLFVATAPVLAPSVLPGAFTGVTAFRLAAAVALSSSDEEQGVELDDFKELAEWVEVEAPAVEAEVLVLDDEVV